MATINEDDDNNYTIEYRAMVQQINSIHTYWAPLRYVKNGRTTMAPGTQFLCFLSADETINPNWKANGDFHNGGYVTKVKILSIDSIRIPIPKEDKIVNVKPKCDPREKLEKILNEAIDNLLEKSTKKRADGLKVIANSLVYNYLPEFIETNGRTLIETIQRSLRYGKSTEQKFASQLLTTLLTQLNDIEVDLTELTSLLQITSENRQISYETRSNCCTALALLIFLDDNYLLDDVKKSMNHLGKIINAEKNIICNDGSNNVLISSALSAWSLLVTYITPNELIELFQTNSLLLSKTELISMLKYENLSVRLAAGHAIALTIEYGRLINNEEFLSENHIDLIDLVEELARDGQRYRSKDNRKIQKKHFRDIREYLKDDKFPELSAIHFGPDVSLDIFQESVKINSWTIYHRYSILRNIIGGGMIPHLTSDNYFIRNFLELGEFVKLNKDVISWDYYRERITKYRQKNRSIVRNCDRNEKLLSIKEFKDESYE